ncbi:16988_t:CDS:1, partial [Racocetra fulgida]
PLVVKNQRDNISQSLALVIRQTERSLVLEVQHIHMKLCLLVLELGTVK